MPVYPQILPQFVTLRRKVPVFNRFITDTLETNSKALFYCNNLSHFSLNIPFPLLSFPYSRCACEFLVLCFFNMCVCVCFHVCLGTRGTYIDLRGVCLHLSCCLRCGFLLFSYYITQGMWPTSLQRFHCFNAPSHHRSTVVRDVSRGFWGSKLISSCLLSIMLDLNC